MPVTLDKREFTRIFKDRFLPLKDMRPGGQTRNLAQSANGSSDKALHTREEFEKLFDAIDARVDTDGVRGTLTIKDDRGNLTPAGVMLERYKSMARGKVDLFK